jgi:hypothetical protein
VRAQVDRDLTIVDYFDRLLGLIKNLERHTDPGGTTSGVFSPAGWQVGPMIHHPTWKDS